MTYGVTALRKIQIGKESTKGTAVPATAALLGDLTMDEAHTIHRPEENRGNLASYTRSVKVGTEAKLSFQGDATFEQILYWLHMGMLGNVTPTGAGSAKTWLFTPDMDGAGVFDSFTIEHGNNIQAYEAEYCMASAIEIAFAMNAPTTIKVDIFGRQKTAVSFTTALTPPTVETILGQKWKLYIDAETGTMGATELAAHLIAASYKINTGLSPRHYGDGNLYFTRYFEGKKSVELKLTLAFSASAETERTKFDGSTLRLVRLQNIGSLISGSDYKKLTLDFCGIYTSFPPLSDRDGEEIVEITLQSQMGSTYTKLFEAAVVNAVAALP
jgi:hypothetical protein